MDTLLTFGSALKLYEDGRIGGYLVKFTDPQHHDLEGEYFDGATDYDIADGAKTSVYLNHRQPLPTPDGRHITVKEKIGEGTLKMDGEGVLIEAILYNAEQYKAVLDKLGWSSGTAPHLVEYDAPQPNGVRHIARWPLGLDASITPMPANPWGSAVMPFKSLYTVGDDGAELEPEDTPEGSDPGTSGKANELELNTKSITEGNTMADENETVMLSKADLAELLSNAVETGTEKALKAWQATQPVIEPGVNVDGLTSQHDNREDKPFKSVGEFLVTVASEPSDPRLRPIKSADPADEGGYNFTAVAGADKVGSLSAAKTKAMKDISGMSEQVPADGGILVGTDRNTSIMERVYNTGELLRRVAIMPISGNSNGMTVYGVDETSRADGSRLGGVLAYWEGEADTATATKPKFREIDLKLKKVFGLVYATDELLQDASALESWVMSRLPDELRFKVEDAIINGTGAGMPLGVLNSDALISVTAEDGQAADSIVAENVIKMWARRWGASGRNYVWLNSQDTEPQLRTMSISSGTAGQLVFMPAGGLSGSQYASIEGRPLIPTEYNPKLGDLGDLLLFDPTQYQMIDKGGIQSAASIHVRFLYDESVFRFIYRIDGQPLWHSALTPKNAGDTQSPYVAIAAR